MNEPSEWLKVMLGEIERKRSETAEAEREAKRRERPAVRDKKADHSR